MPMSVYLSLAGTLCEVLLLLLVIAGYCWLLLVIAGYIYRHIVQDQPTKRSGCVHKKSIRDTGVTIT